MEEPVPLGGSGWSPRRADEGVLFVIADSRRLQAGSYLGELLRSHQGPTRTRPLPYGIKTEGDAEGLVVTVIGMRCPSGFQTLVTCGCPQPGTVNFVQNYVPERGLGDLKPSDSGQLHHLPTPSEAKKSPS